MNMPRAIALPLTALAVIVSGLTIGAAIPDSGGSVTRPTTSPAAACEEDQPCWDCSLMGDHICGPLTDAERDHGWAVWDKADGARSLKVDPSREFRVEYAGWATLPPVVGTYDLVLAGTDGKWHVFRADYTQ